MRKIIFNHLGIGLDELRQLNTAMCRVMYYGKFIGGEEVTAFEREFAQYIGTKYCITTASGFDALQLILRAYNKPGPVVVPTNTCLPTVAAIRVVPGYEPLFTEPELPYYTIAAHIQPLATAYIFVHLYGHVCDIAPNGADLAQYGDALVIEDACQAHGAKLLDRRAGTLGHAAAFSFYPTKNLGCLGDGGAVVTNDQGLADEIRLLKQYGSGKVGINSRLDAMQAAVLRVRLKRLNYNNAKRKLNATTYNYLLRGVPGLTLPAVRKYESPCWHQYVVQHNKRDYIMGKLAERGVETMVHYPVPPHKQMGFKHYTYPIADRLSATVLSLPIAPHLSLADVMYTALVIRQVVDRINNDEQT